jgi:cytochrome c-type biogenesis protein CcmH
MSKRFLQALLLALALYSPAIAVQPDEVLKDPALEARARELSYGFRCLICQNQSIDDSDAPLARDLRIILRERLTAGDTDEQVKGFLVDRYGEFVLLKPRFSWRTALLWGTPLLVLFLGIAGVVLARRRAPRVEPALSAQEQATLERILRK